MSAAVDGAALVYMSFTGVDQTPGWTPIGGTSEATPLFSGVVADAAQAAHHRLGLLNPELYLLGLRRAPGLPDVPAGNNTVSFTQGGQNLTVTGYDAAPGYDLASGLGTVDGTRLVHELSHAAWLPGGALKLAGRPRRRR